MITRRSPFHSALRPLRRGVTLLEAVVVVTIIGIMAGISFPAVSSGLDSIRLHSAADSVGAFLNAAMNRAQRRQEVIEVVVEPKRNHLVLYSTEPGFERTLELPRTIAIVGEDDRRLLLTPGGAFPQFAVDLINAKGGRRRIAIDPVTGSPHISIPE